MIVDDSAVNVDEGMIKVLNETILSESRCNPSKV
jgi:hypothetical protein